MAGIGEIDAAGIEIHAAIKNDVNRRAAREFKFGAAREEHGSESDCRARACSYARTRAALRSDPSNTCADSGRFQNSSYVTCLIRVAVDFSFFVG